MAKNQSPQPSLRSLATCLRKSVGLRCAPNAHERGHLTVPGRISGIVTVKASDDEDHSNVDPSQSVGLVTWWTDLRALDSGVVSVPLAITHSPAMANAGEWSRSTLNAAVALPEGVHRRDSTTRRGVRRSRGFDARVGQGQGQSMERRRRMARRRRLGASRLVAVGIWRDPHDSDDSG